MAGTDRQQKTEGPGVAPVIVLVQPQLGENIGMCARAMLNCNLTELRLVAPRDGWPNEAAVAASSGATKVIDNVRVFATTAEAVADLQFTLATTARGRDLIKKAYTPGTAVGEIRKRLVTLGQKCGILFGPERTGLENDDIARADAILNIPLNPSFSSLNLAQAVLLVSYSWHAAEPGDTAAPGAPFQTPSPEGNMAPASKGDIDNLLRHIEEELDNHRFFRSPDMKPTTLRNIVNMFTRMEMTVQDVNTLHGIVSALTGKRSWK